MENIKYIYFDLDGTIVDNNYNISETNLKAIDYLKSKNIKVGIITGRSIHTVNEIIDKINPDLPTIVLNGGAIYDGNEIFEEKFIGYSSWNAIETIVDLGFNFSIYTKIGIYSNSFNNKNYRKLFDRVRDYETKYRTFEMDVIENINWLKRKRIYKIGIQIDSVAEKELLINKLNHLEDIEICCSSDSQLDILPKDVSKGNALKLVSIVSEININELMVIGDNDNDVSMFDLVPVSVVMRNGSDLAKQHGKIITQRTCEDNGFAHFISQNF